MRGKANESRKCEGNLQPTGRLGRSTTPLLLACFLYQLKSEINERSLGGSNDSLAWGPIPRRCVCLFWHYCLGDEPALSTILKSILSSPRLLTPFIADGRADLFFAKSPFLPLPADIRQSVRRANDKNVCLSGELSAEQTNRNRIQIISGNDKRSYTYMRVCKAPSF